MEIMELVASVRLSVCLSIRPSVCVRVFADTLTSKQFDLDFWHGGRP